MMSEAAPLLLGLVIIALLFLLLRGRESHDAQTELRALLELRDEVRYYMPPSRRAAIEGSILAIVRSGTDAGVAFFISPTAALTAARNLAVRGGGSSHRARVECERPGDGTRLHFDVVALDADLDFAVLRLCAGGRPSPHFLTLSRGLTVAAGDGGLFLVTCNVRTAAGAPDAPAVGVAWHDARVVRVHPRHVLFDSPVFDGDSDGAIVVVARSGEVIGLHTELVSAARERLQLRADGGERLGAVEESVGALVSGCSVGCVGVRIDSDAARGLLGAAF